MMYKMTFNGIRKDYLTVLRKERPPWASLQRNLISVPGKPGAYIESTNIQPRYLKITVLLESKNFQELQKMKEDFAAWLVTDEPKELIFDDEPDRIYYAMVDGEAQFEEIIRVGAGVITFICPDPYKYGPEKEVTFESSASFDVEGTVETEPILECTLKGDVTYVAVSDGEKVNMVGEPKDLDYKPVNREVLSSHYDGSTLVGWTNASSTSTEEVPMMGTLLSSGGKFICNDYGSYSDYWHGPAMKTSLKEPLKDFRIDVKMKMDNDFLNRQAGIIMIFLLDGNNLPVARLMLTKRFTGVQTVTTEFRLGTVDNIQHVMKEGEWTSNYFDGLLRLIREGNVWTSEIVSSGWENWTYKTRRCFTDYGGIATKPITQVQVRLLQSGTNQVIYQEVDDIKVYKINPIGKMEVPILGKSGDVFTFDHKMDNILKNGESIVKHKAFIGDYFGLKPGINTLAVEPASAIDGVKVRYRPKWR